MDNLLGRQAGRQAGRQYCALDLLKLVFALAVVAIHIDPMITFKGWTIYKFYHSLIYLAVPFFFTVSGFFMTKRLDGLDDHSEQKFIESQIKKYFRLYLIWTVIYAPLAIAHYYIVGASIFEVVKTTIIGFFWLGENYNSWILWYLLSSIYSLIFIFVLRRLKLRYETILILGVLIATCAVFLADYKNGVFEFPGIVGFCFDKASKLGARVLTGFFYLPLGLVLGKRNINGKYDGVLSGSQIQKIPLWILVIIGLALEMISPEYGYCYEVGRALSTVGIVGTAVRIELKEKTIYQMMRRLSSALYYWHLWIWTIVCFVMYGIGNMQKGLGIYLFVVGIVTGGFVIKMVLKYKLQYKLR